MPSMLDVACFSFATELNKRMEASHLIVQADAQMLDVAMKILANFKNHVMDHPELKQKVSLTVSCPSPPPAQQYATSSVVIGTTIVRNCLEQENSPKGERLSTTNIVPSCITRIGIGCHCLGISCDLVVTSSSFYR